MMHVCGEDEKDDIWVVSTHDSRGCISLDYADTCQHIVTATFAGTSKNVFLHS